MDVKKKKKKKKHTKIRTLAVSATRRCAHVKGEKLARWPYVRIVLSNQQTTTSCTEVCWAMLLAQG